LWKGSDFGFWILDFGSWNLLLGLLLFRYFLLRFNRFLTAEPQRAQRNVYFLFAVERAAYKKQSASGGSMMTNLQ
jgi:hypothetical protein